MPGAYRKSRDVWGRFDELVPRLGDGPVLALVDQRVIALHAHVEKALRRTNITVVSLRAGERVKSMRTLERLTKLALTMPRAMTVLAIGGGTVGDVATVFAHTFKRGVHRLIHVPSTLLAAVDSSVGGKGAVNVGGAKNVLGVFHAADEGWLCPELFTTLSEAQRREGRIEAWKMVVTLDAKAWMRWKHTPPTDEQLITKSRALKHAIVVRDPYETKGLRVVLNFGHTVGHVIESLSHYRVRHGDAVGMGMLHALDVGVRLGVTSSTVAKEIEESLPLAEGARQALSQWLKPSNQKQIQQLLKADKKGGMILVTKPGNWHHHFPRPAGAGRGSGRGAPP